MFAFRPRGRLTDGEKNFLTALFGTTALSAMLAYVTILRFTQATFALSDLDPLTVWTVAAGGIGGFCAFFSCHRTYLGFPGLVGWIWAGFGAVMITAVAAVIGGTLILPYYGTMFAPFQVVVAMIEFPYLAAAWIAMLVCAHKLLQPWRRERDSIFAEKEPIV